IVVRVVELRIPHSVANGKQPPLGREQKAEVHLVEETAGQDRDGFKPFCDGGGRDLHAGRR
ncbi:hypothetical protein, partial [Bacillus siamensis]|uniref:hypothetical protein n=1 Tax=Bacillus siamensis TaxID=659243 RepID=UPI0039EB2E66